MSGEPRDPGLVCPLPCAYRLGSMLPWPPRLPGIDNWAHGDLPTIVAYLCALGERLVLAEQKMERLEGRWQVAAPSPKPQAPSR